MPKTRTAEELISAIPPVAGEMRAACRCRSCSRIFGRRCIPFGLGAGTFYNLCSCQITNPRTAGYDVLIKIQD